ncbi:MAG: MBL fold metallo-hydrolase [Candidatus Bathyarchaeia archaeon]
MTPRQTSLMDEVRSTRVESGQVAIWWIGQAGYIMKTPKGRVLIIDAYLSGGNRRMMPPPIEPEEIECDLYICTHNHSDHADLETIGKIPDGRIKTFIGPKNVIVSLEKISGKKASFREVNVGDYIDLDGIRLRGTFCIPTDDTVLDSEGFIITTEDGVNIYHSGDTGFHEFLFYLSKHPIDLMFVCINGGMGNMGIDEAVKLTRLLRPRVVVPNHYGMFEENTDDPVRFRTRLLATGADPDCQILKVGEKYLYTPKKG